MSKGRQGSKIARDLAQHYLIRPSATYGHLGDVVEDKLIYDAPTARGIILQAVTEPGACALMNVFSTSFEAIPREIGDAASNLGATNFYRFRDIFIPMLLPGIFAGSIFTFITSLEEFNLTFVIGTLINNHQLGRKDSLVKHARHCHFKIFGAILRWDCHRC